MAYRYWDYPTSTSTYWNTGTGNTVTGSTTTTSATGGTMWGMTNSATDYFPTTTYYYVTEVVEYLIEAPDHWTEADRADLTYLINDATKTGFKLKFWINGDVEITDPNVHRRSMEEFVPLLLSYASAEDKAVIRDFFAKHPLTSEAA